MVGVYWTLDACRRVERDTFLQKWASHQLNLAPLICRVVRAVRVRGRWVWISGWGLPLRSRLFSQPPMYYEQMCHTKLRCSVEMGTGGLTRRDCRVVHSVNS